MRTAPGEYQGEALDFLKESMSNFRDGKWKFAVLHASMAVEMLLKERLVRINPGAVLERIDEPNCRTTVGMSRIMPRLETLGVSIAEPDGQLIRQIVDWRNDVAHRRLSAREVEVQARLAASFKFCSRFLSTELDTQIEDVLSAGEYRGFREYLKEWEDVLAEAHQEAAEAGFVDDVLPARTFDCPECWGPSATGAIKGGRAHCFLCNQDFSFSTCSRCEEFVIGSGSSNQEEEGPTWCESCATDIFGSDD